MKVRSELLINELLALNTTLRNLATSYLNHSEELLNTKPTPESWSALECIEHLNRYGAFYLPEIERRLSANKKPASTFFKSGVLGNYFANSMKPKDKLNKMKTFKNMNPSGSQLDKQVITTFIDQCNTLEQLLEQARTHNLQKVKTAISISTLLKLRLGDTFRFFLYHNERHWKQAERAMKAAKNENTVEARAFSVSNNE